MARLLVFALGFFAVVLIFMALALMGKHQADKALAFGGKSK